MLEREWKISVFTRFYSKNGTGTFGYFGSTLQIVLIYGVHASIKAIEPSTQTVQIDNFINKEFARPKTTINIQTKMHVKLK